MLNQGKSTSQNIQIWLAVIGLIGTLGGAVIANWDKVVPRPEVLSAKSLGPSFDCAKATNRSEHLICSSPDLAVLDLAMANAYRDAAARAGTREHKATLRGSQNHWLRRVRETCDNTDSLRGAYEQRIRELKDIQP
jgi:uncharacterized protein